MKYLRSILIILIALLLLGSSAKLMATKEMPISIVVNNIKSIPGELVLINKMGYLKARTVADIFSLKVKYDKLRGLITFSKISKRDKQNIVFKIGSETVSMDGIKRKMRKSPQIIGDRTYIPLEAVLTRAFQHIVSAQINWNYEQKKIWVSFDGNISDIRHYSYPSYSRFVIELTKDMEYKSEEKNGALEISINGGKVSHPINPDTLKDNTIKNVEIQNVKNIFSLLLYKSSSAGRFKIKKLPSPPRIVVDIENTLPSSAPKKQSAVLSPAGPAKRNKVNLKDIKLIVIDPGHGGKDPGAIGPRGTKEKDITLAIAKELSKYIRKNLKIRTVLTRTNDTFVPLSKRTEIANSKNADLFISIHTNASMNPASRGFEIYFLSTETSDKEAQAVANMENSVMAMEDRRSEKSRVSKILWSLTMNQFMNESSELCGFINSRVKREFQTPNRGVKQAGFYVMRGARMPAVLIETAFISNKKEEKLLNQKEYQRKISDTIARSISEYQRWLTKK